MADNTQGLSARAWPDFEKEMQYGQELVKRAKDELIKNYVEGRFKELSGVIPSLPSPLVEIIDEYSGEHPVVPHAAKMAFDNYESFLSLLPIHKRHAILYLCKDNDKRAVYHMRQAAEKINTMINIYEKQFNFEEKMRQFRELNLKQRWASYNGPRIQIMERTYPKSTQGLHLLFLPILNSSQITKYIIDLFYDQAGECILTRIKMIRRVEILYECRASFENDLHMAVIQVVNYFFRKNDEEIKHLTARLLPSMEQIQLLSAEHRFYFAVVASQGKDMALALRFIERVQVDQESKNKAFLEATRFYDEIAIKFLLSLGISKKYKQLGIKNVQRRKWSNERDAIKRLLEEHPYLSTPSNCSLQ